MVEVKLTYYPPIRLQGSENPTSISRAFSIAALRAGRQDISAAADELYGILVGNCPVLREELNGSR